MDVRYINAFISDVEEIFGVMAPGVQLTRQQPCVKKSSIVTNSIATIIGITGDVKGQVVFVFQMDWGLSLASRMCCGMPCLAVDDMAVSALGEISNMLSGRATSNIHKITGETCDITPPTSLFSTENVNIKIVVPPIICIPHFNEADKVFEINFGLKSSE